MKVHQTRKVHRTKKNQIQIIERKKNKMFFNEIFSGRPLYNNACHKFVVYSKSFFSHLELLAIQNAIQDKEVKAILERSISTISGNSGDKSWVNLRRWTNWINFDWHFLARLTGRWGEGRVAIDELRRRVCRRRHRSSTSRSSSTLRTQPRVPLASAFTSLTSRASDSRWESPRLLATLSCRQHRFTLEVITKAFLISVAAWLNCNSHLSFFISFSCFLLQFGSRTGRQILEQATPTITPGETFTWACLAVLEPRKVRNSDAALLQLIFNGFRENANLRTFFALILHFRGLTGKYLIRKKSILLKIPRKKYPTKIFEKNIPRWKCPTKNYPLKNIPKKICTKISCRKVSRKKPHVKK